MDLQFLSHRFWGMFAALGLIAMPTLGEDRFGPAVAAPPQIIRGPIVRPWPGWQGATKIGQAKLDVDDKYQEQLTLADRYVHSGRYDLAAVVWQKILDEAGDVLITRPEWHVETIDEGTYRRYSPLRDQIETTIASLPEAGLDAYRAYVDVQARKLLDDADAASRERTLATIVKRFFLSSVGDAAALELVSRAMDRYDFTRAIQLLGKIQKYPDSKIPEHAVAIRLAVASAHLGDHAAGRQAITSAGEALDEAFSQRTRTLIQDELQRLAETSLTVPSQSARHPMLLSTEERRGRMPAVPAEQLAGDVQELWYDVFYRDPPVNAGNEPPGRPDPQPRPVPFPRPVPLPRPVPFQLFDQAKVMPAEVQRRLVAPQLVPATTEQMVQKWKSSSWQPSTQVLVAGGRVYFKSHDRLMCRDAATGKLVWLSQPVAYRSVSPIQHTMYRFRGVQMPAQQRPLLPRKAQLFGDRIDRSMTLAGDQLLTLESVAVGAAPTGQRKLWNGQVVHGTAFRSNRVAAYDADTGKLRWTLGGEIEPDKPAGSFLAAPVSVPGGLVVPMWRDQSLWLLFVDVATGKAGWSTRLCGEPEGGRSPWSPVGIGVDGSIAYVATGAGVVVAVDVRLGSVQWASSYRRGRLLDGQTVLDGGREDVAIPHGRLVVVLASDSQNVFALDRRTGQLAWSTSRQLTSDVAPVRYCLGVRDDCVYLAGDGAVRCCKIKGGRALWEYRVEQSFGRGILTDDAIYMPGDGQILAIALDPEKRSVKDRLKQTIPVKREAAEPIGNLASDGRHLFVMGMARIAMLGSVDSLPPAREDGR